MVDVYLLKAKEGDCLFVRYGNENEIHNILIDGGCAECGHTVERIIKQCDNNNEKIDLVVVTHVDEDHIGGLITGFAFVNEEILKRSIQRIAFNTSRGFLQHNKLNGKISKSEEAVKVIVYDKKSLDNDLAIIKISWKECMREFTGFEITSVTEEKEVGGWGFPASMQPQQEVKEQLIPQLKAAFRGRIENVQEKVILINYESSVLYC